MRPDQPSACTLHPKLILRTVHLSSHNGHIGGRYARLLFLGYFLLAGNRLTLAFPGTAVGTRTLTANRQPLTMPEPTITRDIQQTLDIHLHLGTQSTLHLELISNDVPDGIQLIIIPLVHLLVEIDTRSFENVLSSRTTNAKYIGQSDFPSFIFW